MAPPKAGELSNNSIVQEAIEQAWNDFQAADANKRHEEGGWIFMDTTTGQISVGVYVTMPTSVATQDPFQIQITSDQALKIARLDAEKI